MQAPGAGKTKTARMWVYARDERPWGSEIPAAAWYQFSIDRKGAHPTDHLKSYRGSMHADRYSGYKDLLRGGTVQEVACLAHIRRKFVDIHASPGLATAEESIRRIAELYAVDRKSVASRPNPDQTGQSQTHLR